MTMPVMKMPVPKAPIRKATVMNIAVTKMAAILRGQGAVAGVAVLCLSAAALLGGSAPLGRIALSLGLPALAAPLLGDPGWRGVALYRAGQMDRAAEAFRAAGAHLNLGNAEVRRGHFAAALEAYDIARRGGDAAAQANFDLVSAFYGGVAIDPDSVIAWDSTREDGPVVEAAVAEGNARASASGTDSTGASSLFDLPELKSHASQEVRRVFDDRFVVADPRWLATLPDVPGAYLEARIAQERKRRQALGIAPPPAEDPR